VSKLVLHFELLKRTKIVNVQNEYADDSTGFFLILRMFLIRLQETTGKFENREK